LDLGVKQIWAGQLCTFLYAYRKMMAVRSGVCIFFGGGINKFGEGNRLRFYAYRKMIAVKMAFVYFLGREQ